MLRRALVFLFVIVSAPAAAAQGGRAQVAVLDFGGTGTGLRAAEQVAKVLAREGARKVAVLDRGLARAAARGVGYTGSLNMTLGEARDLGSAVGCDFFLTGDAQTIRRSPSERPVYFESYASVFLVSARTGRLLLWDRPAAERPTAEEAEAALLSSIGSATAARYLAAIEEAAAREGRQRAPGAEDESEAVIDLSVESDGAQAPGVREPAPYRRLRPSYPETAARAEAEATVDASVEIDAAGKVTRVEIVRWAGFGLDDEVAATIRRMNFHPAERDGERVAVRVLLRYNFRRPPKEK